VHYYEWRDDFFVFFCTIEEVLRVSAMLAPVVRPDVLLHVVAFRAWADTLTEGTRIVRLVPWNCFAGLVTTCNWPIQVVILGVI
jgi:hypothetical protein